MDNFFKRIFKSQSHFHFSPHHFRFEINEYSVEIWNIDWLNKRMCCRFQNMFPPLSYCHQSNGCSWSTHNFFSCEFLNLILCMYYVRIKRVSFHFEKQYLRENTLKFFLSLNFNIQFVFERETFNDLLNSTFNLNDGKKYEVIISGTSSFSVG